jgi:hypothetical protein
LGLCGFLAWQLISGIKNNLCDLQSKMDKMADHMQALQTKEGCLEVRGRLRETSCDEWRMGTDLDDIRGG